MLSRKEKQNSLRATLWVMAMIMLACQPVIAIGWNEFLVVFLLFAVLLGPLIYRFFRRLENFLNRRRQNK